MKTRPRRVKFRTDATDRLLMKLIGLNKTNRYIAIATGLTESQVSYRASRLPVKRLSLRNGNSLLGRVLEKNEGVHNIIMKYMDRAVMQANLE